MGRPTEPTPASHLPAHELLCLGDAGRDTPLLNKVWPQIVGTFFGVGTGIFINFQTRRPVFSGKSELHNNNSDNKVGFYY